MASSILYESADVRDGVKAAQIWIGSISDGLDRKKLHVYQQGMHFKVATDSITFQQAIDKEDLLSKIGMWVLMLQEYDHKTVHRAATQMQQIDAFNRTTSL